MPLLQPERSRISGNDSAKLLSDLLSFSLTDQQEEGSSGEGAPADAPPDTADSVAGNADDFGPEEVCPRFSPAAVCLPGCSSSK